MFDLARDLPLLLGLVVLLLAAVFLAAAETSIIRISRARVKTLAEHGSRSARRLLGLVQHLPRVLNAVLLTVLLVQIGAATITGQLAERWFGNFGITIASMVLTVVMFVYTEAIPKTFAVQHPDRVALFVAYPVGAIELLLRPLVRVLVWFADLQAPGLGISSSEKGVSEAELRHLAAEAEETGQIASSERDLIERVFRLDERIAEEIMVPRVDIIAVPVEAPVEKAVEVALAAGHRRVPVYQDSLDHIIGVARTKDLLTARDRGLASLRELARPPLVVPGSKRVVALLREMQAADVHIAVVIDEFGGISGLVTIEDVVEELLGEIADEGEPEAAPTHRRVADDRWQVEGGMLVEDLADLLGTRLPEGDWHTAAGLVMSVAGKVPAPGEEFEVEGLVFRVISVESQRVQRIEIERGGEA